jgi:hypothetical protein
VLVGLKASGESDTVFERLRLPTTGVAVFKAFLLLGPQHSPFLFSGRRIKFVRIEMRRGLRPSFSQRGGQGVGDPPIFTRTRSFFFPSYFPFFSKKRAIGRKSVSNDRIWLFMLPFTSPGYQSQARLSTRWGRISPFTEVSEISLFFVPDIGIFR